jgi:hypothetical protein
LCKQMFWFSLLGKKFWCAHVLKCNFFHQWKLFFVILCTCVMLLHYVLETFIPCPYMTWNRQNQIVNPHFIAWYFQVWWVILS